MGSRSVTILESHPDARLRQKASMDTIQATFWGGVNSFMLTGGTLWCATNESHPELMQALAIQSERAGVQTPKLAILECDIPNAFAASKDRIVMTTGLLAKLNFEEATAVLGHELGHVQNWQRHNITRRYVPVGMFGGFVYGAEQAIHHFSPNMARWKTYSMAMAAGVLGQRLGNNIVVRPTEYEADLVGANVSQDPKALASALSKMDPYRDGYVRTTALSWISGYPKTQHRIDRLEKIAECNDVPAAAIADRHYAGRAEAKSQEQTAQIA